MFVWKSKDFQVNLQVSRETKAINQSHDLINFQTKMSKTLKARDKQ
jgi:hypothetical protein